LVLILLLVSWLFSVVGGGVGVGVVVVVVVVVVVGPLVVTRNSNHSSSHLPL